jgi:Fe-S cluster assembly protein SufD
MTVVAEPKERFLDQFEQFDRAAAVNFRPLRQSARGRFRALDFPTPRTEDWRFTSVAPLLNEPFELSAPAAVEARVLPALPAPDALRLVFVNGRFAPELSRLADVPPGIAIGSLADAPEAVKRALGGVAEYHDHVFTALNTGFLADGAYLLVPDGQALERPVDILYLSRPDGRATVSYPRTLVVGGRGATATVIERYLPAGEGTYLTNSVTEFVVGDGAAVESVKLQQEGPAAFHVANTQAALAGGSRFTAHALSFGGRLARNEVRVRFDGQRAEATVNGLYLATGRQHLDNFTVIDHARPHCQSHELYKGILDGHAHGVFNGKIFVRKDAQKTDAKQTNKVLLLSDNATIDTKPQLEIFADDVKCTHGATVGQLDEAQLFYLRTRGIDAESARALLTFAFANDIVGRIPVEALRDELEQVIVRRGPRTENREP